MASYLLLEDGSKLILEDSSGFLLLETQGITGVGVLICAVADMTGVGTVSGVGTPGVSRKYRIDLDPEPITHRQ